MCVCACVPLSVCACLCHYMHEYVGTHVMCAVSALKSVLYMCLYLFAGTNTVSTGKHTLQLVQVSVTVTNLANTETDFQWPV